MLELVTTAAVIMITVPFAGVLWMWWDMFFGKLGVDKRS